MNRRISIYSFVIFLMMPILMANKCGSNIEMITSQADFEGFVTQVVIKDDNAGATIFAESHANKLVHKAIIEVDKNTNCFWRDGEKIDTIDHTDLKVQDKIQVWLTKKEQNRDFTKGIARQIIVSSIFKGKSND